MVVRSEGPGTTMTHDAMIPRRGSSAVAPMSFAQELLWLLDRATPGLTAYNVPRAIEIRGRARRGRAATRAVGRRRAARDPAHDVRGRRARARAGDRRGARPGASGSRPVVDPRRAARERDRAHRAGRGADAVRPVARTAAACAAAARRGRRAHARARDAPHRVGRLVEGGAVSRAERRLRRAQCRRLTLPRAAADPVRRLRCVAARGDAGRAARVASGILA